MSYTAIGSGSITLNAMSAEEQKNLQEALLTRYDRLRTADLAQCGDDMAYQIEREYQELTQAMLKYNDPFWWLTVVFKEAGFTEVDRNPNDVALSSPDTYDSPKEITCDDFDVVTEVQFGGSEGIYLDCYAEGRIQPECEKKRWHLGTYKTLETSLSAMQTLGALGGALTYFASEYLWENGERFLSNRDLRIRALQKRQKKEEAEKS